MSSNPRTQAMLMALLTATLAVPVAVAVDSGGGTVGNSAPTVTAFASAAGPEQSKDTSDIFSGTVRDKNGERRIDQISVSFTTAPGGVSPTLFDRDVVVGDLAVTSEPSFGVDNFKVWNPVANDGLLSFKFQYTWTVNGDYVVRALVDDQTNTDQFNAGLDIAITVSDGFTVSADPVDGSGAAMTSASWGSWTAIPGATSVDSFNYLEVENTGNNPAQVFTLDFTPSAWTGEDDATETFDIDGNIKFACAESSGAAAEAPDDLTFTLGSASASGSVTATFSGLGKFMYCTYQIQSIDDPLLDQDYDASFTAT